ncbi:MAG: DNA-3-methyladenine glycosylase I [Actinomycetota bacterium]
MGVERLRVGPDGVVRCWWCGDDPLYVRYHDEEWGRPVTDETRVFEKLCLEGFQAGLAWVTILRKREAFRAAFDGFDAARMARYGDADVARLVADAGVVRPRGKIEAAIGNPRALMARPAAGGSLAELAGSHAPATPGPAPRSMADVPAQTAESAALSRALKAHGFRFVGPTTAYAAMQALGVVDDHLAGCAARGAR